MLTVLKNGQRQANKLGCYKLLLQQNYCYKYINRT